MLLLFFFIKIHATVTFYCRRLGAKNCSEEGTKIVVTDFRVGHHTDFVMSERAYAGMALPNMAAALFAYDAVNTHVATATTSCLRCMSVATILIT